MTVTKITQSDKIAQDSNSSSFKETEEDYKNLDLKMVEVEFSAENVQAANNRKAVGRKSSLEDNVGAFFKEMARYPLLTAEEEVDLAYAVKFLSDCQEKQQQLHHQLQRTPSRVELAQAMELSSEKQLENRLYKGRIAKRKMIR